MRKVSSKNLQSAVRLNDLQLKQVGTVTENCQEFISGNAIIC